MVCIILIELIYLLIIYLYLRRKPDRAINRKGVISTYDMERLKSLRRLFIKENICFDSVEKIQIIIDELIYLKHQVIPFYDIGKFIVNPLVIVFIPCLTVFLDHFIQPDLATLYQVTTKRLSEQVRRNKNRFPSKFMFRLTAEEYEHLRSQNATSSEDNAHGGRRYMSYVFTEQGIAMLSAVLKSDIAVEVSIKIMNSFVEMRRFLLSNKEMFARLDRVELKQLETDKKLEEVFNYIATKAAKALNIKLRRKLSSATKS